MDNSTAPPGEPAPRGDRADGAKNTPTPPPAAPAVVVFSLAALVIVSAFASVLYWFFSASAVNQYPIVLALVCFVLSTVSCLLFAANAKIEAALPAAAITIGGPAVVWVATLFLISYLLPPPTVTTKSLLDVLREQQDMEGWRTFPEWIKQLGELGQEVQRDESNHVRNVMDSAFNTGRGRQKVGSPLIQYLIVYLDDKFAIDFQRIRGSKGDIAEIYFRSHTTGPGTASSVLLAKSGDAIIVSELSGEKDWSEVRNEVLDCLIITTYDEGLLARGDFIYWGTNKFRRDGNAVMDIGIMTPTPVQTPKSWLFRGSTFPLPDEIPIQFRRFSPAWSTNADPVVSQLSEWFDLLDRKPMDARLSPGVAQFIDSIRAKLPDSSYAKFHKSPMFKSTYSTHLNDLTEAVAITYERK
jgi:hypothetical protein